KMSVDARKWGHSWYEHHWLDPRPLKMASDRLNGYHARKQTHIHKLAIILAAAQSDQLLIEQSHLEEAANILKVAEIDMLKVYESIGMVDEAKNADELTTFVRAHTFLTTNQLYSLVRNIMSQKEFEDSLKAAIRSGLLVVEKRNGLHGVT